MISTRLSIVFILLAPLAVAQQGDPYLVGAHYYLWYRNGSWANIDGDPLLGTYDSAQDSVISQHIRWARNYGIDFFGVEWGGKDREQDEDMRKHFLVSPDLKGFQFCIAYDTLTHS